MTKLLKIAQKAVAATSVVALVFGVTTPALAVAADLGVTISNPANGASFVANRGVSFTANPVGGTAPYTYSWNFGDGTVVADNDPNITHSFGSTGAKTVTVRVTDDNAAQVTSAPVTVNITTADLTASINSPANNANATVNQGVNFVALVSGGAAPYTYSWNFGDGTVVADNDQNINHSYGTAGAKTVNLKVTDDAGAVVNANPITVNVGPDTNSNELNVAITAPTNTNQNVNQGIAFVASVTGGKAPYTYSWNFGDGTVVADNDPNISHSYGSTGVKTVTVRVTDDNTVQKTASITLTVGDNTQPEELVFSNIRVTDVTKTSAVVRWTTNLPSTSRVIYDTTSHESIAGESAPNYGYANSSAKIDIDTKVTEHAVTLTDLTPNTHYFYRVLSAK